MWEWMLAAVANHPDLEHGQIDNTIVRQHPNAAGAHRNSARSPKNVSTS